MLADGPEPMRLLVAELFETGEPPNVSVSDLRETLDRLEAQGHVEVTYHADGTPWGPFRKPTRAEREQEWQRLLTASGGAELNPNGGLFYRMTATGEQLFNRLRRPDGGLVEHWRTVFVPSVGELTIEAPDDDAAERAFERWSQSNPGIPLSAADAIVERGVRFVDRSGYATSDGVRWTLRTSAGRRRAGARSDP